MAVIHQSGGGTGFSFSRLRPAGDTVQGTPGVASGPVSFLAVFDAATAVVKQGGRRRGANMGVLRVDHPDVLEFVRAKQTEGRIANFNLSVATTDAFWHAVRRGPELRPREPARRQGRAQLDARRAARRDRAGRMGERRPGHDLPRRRQPREPDTRSSGPLEATNPCGELPLLREREPAPSARCASTPSCAAARSTGRTLDAAVDLGVRFLDDVIEVSRYPFPEIAADRRAATARSASA